jgi:hypothetical protein
MEGLLKEDCTKMYSSIHMSPDTPVKYGNRRGGHRMVVGFTFTLRVKSNGNEEKY